MTIEGDNSLRTRLRLDSEVWIRPDSDDTQSSANEWSDAGYYDTQLKPYFDAMYQSDPVSVKTSIVYSYSKENTKDDELTLLEMFFSLKTGWGFVDLGKRKEGLGYSYLRSPLDVLMQDPKSDGKDRDENIMYSEGLVMLSTEKFLSRGVLSLTYVPELKVSAWGESMGRDQEQNALVRYSQGISWFDTTFLLGYDERPYFGLGASKPLGSSWEIHAEIMRRYGDKAPKLYDTGGPELMAEPLEEAYGTEALVGISSFVGQSRFTLEYYYTSLGHCSDVWDEQLSLIEDKGSATSVPILDAVQEPARDLVLVRHYFGINCYWKVNDDWELYSLGSLNLEDYSGSCSFSLGYVGIDNITLSTMSKIVFGDEVSEYNLVGPTWEVGFGVTIHYNKTF
jgi:hypothetical protein